MEPYNPPYLPLNDEYVDVLKFVDSLYNAGKCLATYKTVIKKTKLEQRLMLAPLTKIEALFSTKIEGTQATLNELYEAEISSSVKNKGDINEVENYTKCFVFATNYVRDYPISTRLFKNMHKILLSGDVRGKNKSPGEFRRIQNYIGKSGCTIKTASFVPPSPNLIETYMSNLDEYINSDAGNNLIKTAIIHAQFETIHPFLDGNGRVGRVLIPLCLYKYKELDNPYFFVSQGLEKDKFKYYKLLNSTRNNTKEDWTNWVKFFVEAIAEQATKNVELINQIDELFDETMESIKVILNCSRGIDLVNYIFKHPIFTVKSLSNELRVSASTARNYISKMSQHQIIYENDSYRNRKYYFYALIEILGKL